MILDHLHLLHQNLVFFLNLNKFLNPEVNKLKAWKISENGIKVKSKVLSEDRYDIYGQKIVPRTENVLDIEINIERNFQHYLLKIMLPVFLILCVAWYVLWIPTEKYEARLNTSIIALLALIAYNFVFQDDIPKLNSIYKYSSSLYFAKHQQSRKFQNLDYRMQKLHIYFFQDRQHQSTILCSIFFEKNDLINCCPH